MQLITLSYNRWQKLWELRLDRDPGRLVGLRGFVSTDSPDDFEKANGILGTCGLKLEGIHWKADEDGWRVLVTRREDD